MGRANSKPLGTMFPVGGDAPTVSASLIAFLSMAWLAASRTRLSAHGDFGSHMSKKSR